MDKKNLKFDNKYYTLIVSNYSIYFIEEDNLKEYFGGVWKPDWAKFEQSGYQLIEKINDLKPESVLDIGCGYNQLNEKIPNLFGIDPYNSAAD